MLLISFEANLSYLAFLHGISEQLAAAFYMSIQALICA